MPFVDRPDFAAAAPRSAAAQRDRGAGVDDDPRRRTWRKAIAVEARKAARGQLGADLLSALSHDHCIKTGARLFGRFCEGEIAPGVVTDCGSDPEIAVLARAAGAADVRVAEADDQPLGIVTAGRSTRRVGAQRYEAEGDRGAGHRVAAAIDADEWVHKIERRGPILCSDRDSRCKEDCNAGMGTREHRLNTLAATRAVNGGSSLPDRQPKPISQLSPRHRQMLRLGPHGSGPRDV